MIHWCLSVLPLKVEKSFDDGGLRLTDKSWMPPTSPPGDAPHLSYYLVMCSTFIAMVTHCYFISSLPRKFKLKAEELGTDRGCLCCSVFVSLPTLSPFWSLPVWIRSSYRMHFCRLWSATEQHVSYRHFLCLSTT